MSESEQRLYHEAAKLARAAMGKRMVGNTRARHEVIAADEDPAAWWELTEGIVSIAQRHAAA